MLILMKKNYSYLISVYKTFEVPYQMFIVTFFSKGEKNCLCTHTGLALV